jgi:hypothetical protein
MPVANDAVFVIGYGRVGTSVVWGPGIHIFRMFQFGKMPIILRPSPELKKALKGLL